jgi:hypothetical protein
MKKKGKKEKEKEPDEVIDVEAKDVEEPKQIKGDSPKEIEQKNDKNGAAE